MVIAMLALLITQVALGLFANDEIGFYGPLADKVHKQSSDLATKLHGQLFNVLIVFIWLHLVAVFFYVLVKRQNLLKAMIEGKKPTYQAGDISLVYFVPRWRILAVSIVAIALPLILIL